MKKTVMLVILAGFVASSVFAEASKKSVEQLMKAMKMEEQYNETMKKMSEAQFKGLGAGNPAMMKAVQKFQDKYLTWSALKPDIVKIYSKAFTDSEIKGLIKFYKTPIGKKLLEKQPGIQLEMTKMTMKVMQEHMPEFQKMMMDAMKE